MERCGSNHHICEQHAIDSRDYARRSSKRGHCAVTVFNPTPGGGTSGSLSFALLSCGSLYPDGASAGCGAQQGVLLYAAGKRRYYALYMDGLDRFAARRFEPCVRRRDFRDSAGVPVIRLQFYSSGQRLCVPARTLTQPFSILVRSGSLGRNDSCNTATPVSNGVTPRVHQPLWGH